MISIKLSTIAEYNYHWTPKILGGWLPVENDEFVVRCADCLINYTIVDVDAIFEGDVEIYDLKCGKCKVPIFKQIDKWIPCPSNFDGGLDCTPFCPTCEGVQFIRNEEYSNG